MQRFHVRKIGTITPAQEGLKEQVKIVSRFHHQNQKPDERTQERNRVLRRNQIMRCIKSLPIPKRREWKPSAKVVNQNKAGNKRREAKQDITPAAQQQRISAEPRIRHATFTR